MAQSVADKLNCRAMLATPSGSGAVAIVQLIGDVEPVLAQITGRCDWPNGSVRLADLAGIDHGVVTRITAKVAQLMPHGGPRVVQKLFSRLSELGATIATMGDAAVDPNDIYPEATDAFEALMLHALANVQSPLAIDLLLDQPRRWRAQQTALTSEDRTRSRRLNRLLNPPTVVLAGLPNVGKSTLSNALLGRSMSIALDQPGTTRDYTVGRIDLAGLVVPWYDTPGIRTSDDPIESRAIEIAQRLIANCDLLIAMTDVHEQTWPELPREPDLRVINKCDLKATQVLKSKMSDERTLRISATTGEGIAQLVTSIRNRLISSDDLANPAPWLFDPRLESLAVSRKT